MIVGRGLMAQAFASEFALDSGVTVFASGVSNSGEDRLEAFLREEDLLRRSLESARECLVYFSTCSVEDPERGPTAYVRHKLRMESVVRGSASHLVLRLPQVVGRTPNPHTLTNYLYARMVSGEPFSVWQNAVRNLIDVDDVATIAAHMIRHPAYRNRTLNIAAPSSIRVVDLVALYERVLGVRANMTVEPRGSCYPIDTSESAAVAARLGVRFGGDYVERLIGKYYGDRGVRT